MLCATCRATKKIHNHRNGPFTIRVLVSLSPSGVSVTAWVSYILAPKKVVQSVKLLPGSTATRVIVTGPIFFGLRMKWLPTLNGPLRVQYSRSSCQVGQLLMSVQARQILSFVMLVNVLLYVLFHMILLEGVNKPIFCVLINRMRYYLCCQMVMRRSGADLADLSLGVGLFLIKTSNSTTVRIENSSIDKFSI